MSLLTSHTLFSLWSLALLSLFVLIFLMEIKNLWSFFFFQEFGTYTFLLGVVSSTSLLVSFSLFLKTFLAPILMISFPSLFKSGKKFFIPYLILSNSLPFSILLIFFSLNQKNFFLWGLSFFSLIWGFSMLQTPLLLVYFMSGSTCWILCLVAPSGSVFFLSVYFFQTALAISFLGLKTSKVQDFLGVFLGWAPLSLGLITKLFLVSSEVVFGLFLLWGVSLLVLPGFFLLTSSKMTLESKIFLLNISFFLFLGFFSWV